MKGTKLKRIFSCFIFSVLLIGAITMCANILESKEARIKYTPFYESKTNFDVIFLGTSHMLDHVLPMEMWNDYGISSYNWAYANCTPAENYYLIQDIFKYTSPKVIVIDLYGLIEYDDYNNGKYRTDRIEQQHVQFDSLPVWSLSKYRASKDVFDDYDNNNDFIWDFIMYHNRWSVLGKSDFEYDITTEKGSWFLTGLGTGEYTPIDKNEKIEINSVCYQYLLRSIEYCEKQGVEVLCVYIPYGNCGEDQQKVANSIDEIVEQYPNCSYVNMLNKNILNYNTDICDGEHLNYSGALKVTNWLGNYLVANYSLDDYSLNESWKDDYESYLEYKKKVITSQNTFASYLVQLCDDDFQAEVEVYNQNMLNSEILNILYDNAGVNPVFVENDTDKCARLILKDNLEEVIDDVTFTCDNIDDIEILNIKKVEE